MNQTSTLNNIFKKYTVQAGKKLKNKIDINKYIIKGTGNKDCFSEQIDDILYNQICFI